MYLTQLKKRLNLILTFSGLILECYRFAAKSSKLKAGLGLLLFLFCFSAQSSMYGMYKTKDFKGIVENFGTRYLTLDYNELVLLGEAYKQLNNYDRQIKILKHLNIKKPNYYKIHLEIANASKAKAYESIISGKEYKTYQQALTDTINFYRSAIRLNPKSIAPYESLSAVYKDQENVSEGLALTKTMLDQFGEKPSIVLDLCEWTSKFGLVAQTQRACSQAATLSPLDPKPLINMALAIRDSGEKEKYQAEVFKIYQRFSNSERVIDLIGSIHIENKDFINAERALIKNKDSKLESSRINLATALYENEKYDLALQYFAQSCPLVNEDRKKLLRFFESRLRRLEINGMENMSFKFQKELNVCRSTPVVIAQENRVRPSHFSEGIRLPANARDLDGQTLEDKRFNYEQSKLKGEKYKSSSDSKQNSKSEIQNR